MTNGIAVVRPPPVAAPWRSIWRQPVLTFRRLAHENPGYGVYALPLLAGTAGYPVITVMHGGDADDITLGYLAQSMLAFPLVLEWLQLFVLGFVVSRLAPLFGGQARIRATLSALAWSNAPIVVLSIVNLTLLIIVLALDFPRREPPPVELWIAPLVIQSALIIWSKTLVVIGCAEVLKTTRLRAALCVTLAWSTLTLALVGLAILLGGIHVVIPLLFDGLSVTVGLDGVFE